VRKFAELPSAQTLQKQIFSISSQLLYFVTLLHSACTIFKRHRVGFCPVCRASPPHRDKSAISSAAARATYFSEHADNRFSYLHSGLASRTRLAGTSFNRQDTAVRV